MNFEKRILQEINLIKGDDISYRDSLNKQKLLLRGKENNIIISTKRKSIIEQMSSNNCNLPKDKQFQIYKFESSYNKIILYLTSSDNELVSYCLNLLSIYFKYNEPSTTDQKIIKEGQFFEILLHLGNKFLYEKNENNLIKIIWILMNIQVYSEGNNDYLKIIYDEKYMEFYNDCFTKFGSDEIINEIIVLLSHISKINSDINYIIMESKVFSSIIKYGINNNNDMEVMELIIKLTVNCLNTSNNYDLNEKDVNIINDCIIILINELSDFENEKIQKLCFEGLYKITKIDNKYKFNEKLIKEGIVFQILKMKNNNNVLKSLKILANILSVSDKYCKLIYEANIIDYYNNILINYDDDCEYVFTIFCGLFNISASKNRNIIQDSIIWSEEKIQKYFNMDDKIKILFIKIIKYMIYDGNQDCLEFIYFTKILEYLIFLLSSFTLNEKVSNKIFKVVDIYLKQFKEKEIKSEEYYIIFQKFQDLIKSLGKKDNDSDI